MLVRDLSFNFGKKNIFSGVHMDFPIGLITGVVGKNGVGKTTFFRVIKGLYQADSGSVTMDKEMLDKSEIGFLPTQPYFYPYMKAKEYMELVLGSQNSFTELAELFELPMEQLVQNYSTGMQKKLAFAGIMGLGKPVHILDEPFNGVDLQSNVTISRILQLEKEKKVTIISSHMLDSMLTLCDRIYYVEDSFQYSLYEKGDYGSLEDRLALAVDEKLKNYLDNKELNEKET